MATKPIDAVARHHVVSAENQFTDTMLATRPIAHRRNLPSAAEATPVAEVRHWRRACAYDQMRPTPGRGIPGYGIGHPKVGHQVDVRKMVVLGGSQRSPRRTSVSVHLVISFVRHG